MASIPQGQVGVSSSSFHIHNLTKNMQTGGNMEVTAPVLVVKSKDDIEKFVQALPLLTGALVTQAGRAGGKKILSAAAKRFAAAKNARTAGKATQVPKGNTLNALRGKEYTGMRQNPVKVRGYKNIPEGLNLPEGAKDWDSYLENSQQVKDLQPQVSSTSTQPSLLDFEDGGSLPETVSQNPNGRQIAGAKQRALQAEVDNQGLKTTSTTETQLVDGSKAEALDAGEKQALLTGGVGVVSGAQQMASQTMANNQANQKAEMERLEGLAEDARAKASTGTGGKVAVA